MSDIREVAQALIDQGWSVVPLVKGEKRAETKWRTRTYTPANFKPDDGIAGKCGEPSGWRVDVDLDALEALEAAKALLPATGLVHGRPGKPDSHYWYICPGIKPHVFKDVKDSTGGTNTLVEIRSTGGYTALPPSGHPSGDVLAWSLERDPMRIEPDALIAGVRNVAIATLLARHWPGGGARHHAAGHLAGFLLRYGVEPLFVSRIIETAGRIAKDPDLKDRMNFVRSTIAKWEADKDTALTGGPKLAEAMGAEVVARLRTWLGVADDDAIEQMNQRHFWVRLGKDDVIGREDDPSGVVFQKVRSLYSEYANKQIKVGEKASKDGDVTPVFKPVFQAWLEHPSRRTYRNVVFCPPPLVAAPEDYNLWKGFAIEPAPGRCELFLEHMRDVICGGNAEHLAYLMNLLALTIQEPGTPSGVAVVLRGDPGAGKGIFVRALTRIFGRHHSAHLDRVEDLVGFNAIVSGKVIVFADEAFWAGDKREIGALKRIITEPTIRITRKGIDSHEEKNCIHLFMATNEDWSVPAQMKERRFLALQVSGHRRGDHRYFDAITREMDGGGYAAFLDLMLKYPLDRDAVKRVPKTKELRAQQSISLSTHMEWWQDVLMEGRISPTTSWRDNEWLPSGVLYQAYMDWSNARRYRVLSNVEFGRRLSDYFTTQKSAIKRVNKEPVRCVLLRPLAEARAYFDKELAAETDWPEPEGASAKTQDIPF